MMRPMRPSPRTTGKLGKAARKMSKVKRTARAVKGRGTVNRSRDMY